MKDLFRKQDRDKTLLSIIRIMKQTQKPTKVAGREDKTG